MPLSKSAAKARALSHQKIVKNQNGTWKIVNKKIAGKSVIKRKFNSTKLHKSKSKSIYSFHHGKKYCGQNGIKGKKGWCQGQRRKITGNSYWLRTRNNRRSSRQSKRRKLSSSNLK